jgi:ABC-type polysaccharide/polyol phosphate transport system ATPase subunit
MDTPSNNNDPVIRVENLSKIYKLYNKPIDRMKESLHPFRKTYHKDFYALKNIAFEINRGEIVGIIGRNGSGKSSLLKVITGVLSPTTGGLQTKGKISALLELGSGFNPEFTGIENIYFNGAIMGYSREQMANKVDDILSFADIGEFVYQPVKRYSSGMFVRLAFAVATNVDPDILIIDEALSVGDSFFQIKCMNKMREFMNDGRTILFVSHDSAAIKTLCSRGILLEKGSVVKDSSASSAIDYYCNSILNDVNKGQFDIIEAAGNETDQILQNTVAEVDMPIVFGENSINTGEVELLSVKIVDDKTGKTIDSVVSEETVRIVWKLKMLRDFNEPHYGVMIKNRLGNSAFETNTYCMGIKPPAVKSGDIVNLCFRINFNLFAEDYSISLGFANKGYAKGLFEEYVMLAKDVKILKVTKNEDALIYFGYYNMKPEFTLNIRTLADQ